MKKVFKVKFNNTRTPISRIAVNTRNLAVSKCLYQASDIGYEYNKPGYYHNRKDGPFYLLAYTKSGEAFLTYRGKEITVRPNSLIFISLLEPSVIETFDSDWEIYFLHVVGSDIDNIYKTATKHGFYIENFDGKFFIDRINEIYDSYTTNYDKYFVSKQIYSLLLDVLKQTENNSCSDMVARAVRYLEQNFSKNISIENMCQELFVSKFHLIRKFELEMKLSPKQYITFLRIQKAKSLLTHTEKSVKEIAQIVGFKTEKNINYAFKTTLGITPNTFRKNLYNEV